MTIHIPPIAPTSNIFANGNLVEVNLEGGLYDTVTFHWESPTLGVTFENRTSGRTYVHRGFDVLPILITCTMIFRGHSRRATKDQTITVQKSTWL